MSTVEHFAGKVAVITGGATGIGLATARRLVGEGARVVEVNLLGPMLTVKHAARRMPDGGSIIITASLNAVQPAVGLGAYCCSKAALAMLTRFADASSISQKL
jgi:3-oxoacyl-[acyl-carrier protein] reductase